jgi:hypothetical protein
MHTRPSTLDVIEKPVPATRRRRVGAFILGGLIGMGLGVLGGLATGFIGMLIGNARYPSIGLGTIALLIGPIITFPTAGMLTGLVTAAQRSVERGALVGAIMFGGAHLALSIPSIAEFWMVMAVVVVVGVIIGTLIGGASAGMSAALSPESSAFHPVHREAGQ